MTFDQLMNELLIDRMTDVEKVRKCFQVNFT